MGLGIKKDVEEAMPGSLSPRQVKRVVRISENNDERANRVLDRMKKRKGIEGDMEIVKGVGIKRQFTKEEQEKSSGTGGLKQTAPLASGSSGFKQVDLKSEPKPLASASSGFKQVDLKAGPEKMESVKAKTYDLSQKQIDRVANIKNYARSQRVLDRMKKRSIED